MSTPPPAAPGTEPPDPDAPREPSLPREAAKPEAAAPDAAPREPVPPEPPPPPPVAAGSPRPPRTFGWFSLILVALLSAAVAGVGGYFIAHRPHASDASDDATTAQYQCPMHPTIVQDHPGDCPICGMKLVKMGPAGSAAASGNKTIKFYRSPMDPKQTSPVPRKDEMGMDFIPVYADDDVANDAPSVEGLATVDIDPSRQQLIGLKTVAVTRGKVSGSFRTVGRVATDETRVRHVNVKVPVYVERVYVDFVGKPVRKGAALFTGYSPELLAAQEEYRIALSTRKSQGAASAFSVDSAGLIAASRRKLELWDVPKSAIRRLEQEGKPLKTLTFHSPIAGVVIKKDVVEGMKLDEGAMPYEIADLSRVWVLADIYESDLHRVKLGMQAKLTLKAYPNRVFEGSATFLDPVLDPVTRTVKLRLEFANANGDLKPAMFGEVVLENAERDGLRIPEDAVIDSGSRKVVFVALQAGRFEPRQVSLGDSDGSGVEVLSGLTEGEKVVVRANFLVDSESRLRASLAALSAPAATASVAPMPSAAPSVAVPTPTSSRAAPAPQRVPARPKATAEQPPQYSCPMHAEVTDTKPSRCPKCGMFLTPSEHKAE
ncbi:MAG: efflux RND transporter periplasmic adaptor subunit [Myxococcales bacterium]|nr:efflux RND transporter periplasmic adaptor subunit [Myxococcales bacterium]